jgi:hypothetical protein
MYSLNTQYCTTLYQVPGTVLGHRVGYMSFSAHKALEYENSVILVLQYELRVQLLVLLYATRVKIAHP